LRLILRILLRLRFFLRLRLRLRFIRPRRLLREGFLPGKDPRWPRQGGEQKIRITRSSEYLQTPFWESAFLFAAGTGFRGLEGEVRIVYGWKSFFEIRP
jgi:hypothetical protein